MTITIYGAILSPFVRKVHVALLEKGIPFEGKPIGLGSDDPDFLAASPFRKIPAMADGDYLLSDSTAICTYLDAQYPETPLIPADPRARGRVMQYDELADTVLVASFAKPFFNRIVSPRFLGRPGDLAAADRAVEEELPPLFAWLEQHVPDHGFLVGDSLSLADIAVASPFANLEHCDIRPDPQAYPRLCAWLAGIRGRASFARIWAMERKILG